MSLTPTGLDWGMVGRVGAGLALAISILYLLRTRRRAVQVPFSPLWAEVLHHREASSLWRNLKRLLSWLLATLLGALILFAAADLRPKETLQAGRAVVVLVDRSASMGAADLPGGRLPAARALARKLVDGLAPMDRMMLLAVDREVTPLASFGLPPDELRAALDELGPPRAAAADWDRALRFARAALRDRARAEIVVIGDGANGPSPEQLQGEPAARLVQVGQGGDNAAILAFNVRRYPANRMSYEVFVRVKSYFERPIQATLQIRADGALAEQLPLTLQPGEDTVRMFPDLAALGRRLQARLVYPADVEDHLPADDVAYALLPELRRLDVTLVTAGNLFLEAALLLNEQVRLRRLSPAEYAADGPVDADVVVLDRVAPHPEQGGARILVAPPAGSTPWEVRGELKEPEPTKVARKHPLMRWVVLRDLNVQSAQKVRQRRGDVLLVGAGRDPLLVARRDRDRATLLLTFDPTRSDLPLRTAFPMLLINAFEWFFEHDASLLTTYRTGETWRVRVGRSTRSVRWLRPDGSAVDVPAQDGSVALRSTQIGFHSLQLKGADSDGDEVLLAANLADAHESDLRVQASGSDGGPAAPGPEPAAAPSATPASFGWSGPLWILMLLTALGLLAVEWLTYHRRVTV